MDTTEIPKGCVFAGFFQHLINDMKNSTPLWEDFILKSSKLHSCLRAVIQALGAFLDAFQKIADAASATKGPTKDIGTALTRICLRHKAVESRLRILTSAIVDDLVVPLQERLEEWKKTTAILDKKHAKEYKRNRSEFKKSSFDTVKMQKKFRKPSHSHVSGMFSGTLTRSHGKSSSSEYAHPNITRDVNLVLEAALRETAEKKQIMDNAEKQAVKTAMIEDRSRFCSFAAILKPLVTKEVDFMYELNHVQEAMTQLEEHSRDPYSLTDHAEQIMFDLEKSAGEDSWTFETPPSSPSSLGSRKSSMCSISSVNSSSSGSLRSPTHHHNVPRSILDAPSSQSGKYYMPGSNESSNSSTPSFSHSSSTNPSASSWPNAEESKQFEKAASAIMNEKPSGSIFTRTLYQSTSEIYGLLKGGLRNDSKPPVPKRCSSLERHQMGSSGDNKSLSGKFANATRTLPLKKSRSKKEAKEVKRQLSSTDVSPTVPDFNESAPDMVVPQPVYVNMHELNRMAARKQNAEQRLEEENELPSPPSELNSSGVTNASTDRSSRSQGSLASSGYGSQSQIVVHEDYSGVEEFGSVKKPEIYGRGRWDHHHYNISSAEHSRRSSVSSQHSSKPPPPVRRNSSISSSPSRNTSPIYASLPQGTANGYYHNNRAESEAGDYSGSPNHQYQPSIGSNGSSDSVDTTPHVSMERLPPPPAYLMAFKDERQMTSEELAFKRMSVAEAVKTLTQKNHQPVSPNMIRRSHSMKTEPDLPPSKPPKGSSNKTSKENKNRPTVLRGNNGNSNALVPMKSPAGPPGSRGGPTAAQMSQLYHHRGSVPMESPRMQWNSSMSPNNSQPIYETVNNSASNGRLPDTGGSLRQTSRRFSEELLRTTASFVQNHVLGNRTPPPVISTKEAFVQSLNAKLSHMRSMSPAGSPAAIEKGRGGSDLKQYCNTGNGSPRNSHQTGNHNRRATHHLQRSNSNGSNNGSGVEKSSRVRQWISSRTIADPNDCRDSLMDQIRRGKKLRRTHVFNDRSAPRIH